MGHIIYLRKSRADMEAEARGEGETLARHEKTLLELARRQHLNIVNIYREIVSGETIAARPEVQRLLSDVESGTCEGVLVMEIERLARGDTIDQGIIAQTFKRSGTKIITPVKTYDPNNEFDEEYFEFGLFMARREYKTINRRIQRGRIASVKEGKFIGSQPPFGYDKIKITGDSGYTLAPNTYADIVRLIYDMYVNQHLGMSRVSARLTELYPIADKTWSRSSINDILSNPVYTGKIRWSYKKETKKTVDGTMRKERHRSQEYILVDGLHEPIIDLETFDKAQIIKSGRAHAPVKGSEKLKNPFTGLIFCGKCGCMMTRLAPNSRNQYDVIKCPNIHCPNVSAPVFMIEEKLIEFLDSWLREYKVRIKIEEKEIVNEIQTTAQENALLQITSQIDKVKKQIENTYDLLEQEIYSKETFLERNGILTEKLKALDAQKNSINNELSKVKSDKHIRQNIIPRFEYVIDGYFYLADAAEKNNLLKSIISKIEYTKSERNTRGHLNNYNFELSIHPII